MSDRELTEQEWATLQEADQAFDVWSKHRYEKGKEEYGAYTFLDNPTLEMALEELVDLANYARFTFIKIYMLQRALVDAQNRGMAKVPGGFVPTTELLGQKL